MHIQNKKVSVLIFIMLIFILENVSSMNYEEFNDWLKNANWEVSSLVNALFITLEYGTDL